jgi:hypothetical protein
MNFISLGGILTFLLINIVVLTGLIGITGQIEWYIQEGMGDAIVISWIIMILCCFSNWFLVCILILPI